MARQLLFIREKTHTTEAREGQSTCSVDTYHPKPSGCRSKRLLHPVHQAAIVFCHPRVASFIWISRTTITTLLTSTAGCCTLLKQNIGAMGIFTINNRVSGLNSDSPTAATMMAVCPPSKVQNPMSYCN